MSFLSTDTKGDVMRNYTTECISNGWSTADENGECWPAIDTIAQKMVGVVCYSVSNKSTSPRGNYVLLVNHGMVHGVPSSLLKIVIKIKKKGSILKKRVRKNRNEYDRI